MPTYVSATDALTFADFVRILRPIMMETYVGNNLREVFNLLDKDQSGGIDINESYDVLSISRSNFTKETLLHYVGNVGIKTRYCM
ncbi:unnamed protein product [Rotaria sp. Silwood2]|nr:unnamed protein product [Rotaria sp. Silwood2]CAF2902030.1 unnamed protein product [Rotaria sp. Silwood2]CAF4169737.1 unnamed protein product [Rotaria sp. Silwood2]